MSVLSSRYCPTCREYMGSFGDPHACATAWMCQTVNDDDDDWGEWHAETADLAAEKVAESYWQDDRGPEQDEELEVRVREGETVHVFDVVAEYSLSFTARRKGSL